MVGDPETTAVVERGEADRQVKRRGKEQHFQLPVHWQNVGSL